MIRLNGYILKVSTKISRCKIAKMQARICYSYSGWTQTSLWITLTRKFDRGCAQESTKRRSKVRVPRALIWFSIVLCNATSRSCEGACLNHDVCWLVEQGETIEVETPRHQQSTFPANSLQTQKHQSSSRRSSEMW